MQVSRFGVLIEKSFQTGHLGGYILMEVQKTSIGFQEPFILANLNQF
jgi:hypothetical protein